MINSFKFIVWLLYLQAIYDFFFSYPYFSFSFPVFLSIGLINWLHFPGVKSYIKDGMPAW